MSEALQRQVSGLAALLALQGRARNAENREALAFVCCNETHDILPYRQAVFWDEKRQLLALSGTPVLDPQAPYTQWLSRLIQVLPKDEPIRRVTASVDLPHAMADDWGEWLPNHVLRLDMSFSNRPGPTLLLARDEPWSDQEISILDPLRDAYAHAWAALPQSRARRPQSRIKQTLIWALFGMACASLFLPVRLSVLAPAEVIARDARIVRAPLDGVISDILVEPYTQVESGQALLQFDTTDLVKQWDVASKALAVAAAEHRQVSQKALFDSEAQAQVEVLQKRLEQHETEVAYLSERLDDTDIRAMQTGIVVYQDRNEWRGRSVSTGEKILMLAQADEVELEIQLPMADGITTEPGASVKMFLNIAPDQALGATLYYAAYQAQATPDGTMAYRLKASFKDGHAPRIGLQGTAKIYGEQVSLFYYLFRRPLATLRQWLGL